MAVVRMERVDNRIHVDWSAGSASWSLYKDRVKRIIGSRFVPSKRVWSFPLDLETCRRFRDEFKDELEIGPSLWGWATEERAKEMNATALLDISKIDLTQPVDLEVVPRVAPTMWAAMQNRPYQPVATKYMAAMQRCLNADQPGIGKTIETLGALIERGVTGRILILAPKTSCMTVWPVEIERWLANDVPYTITQMSGLTPAKRDAAWTAYEEVSRDVPGVMHFLIANAEQAGIKKFTACPAGTCDGDEDWCPNLDRHMNKSETRRPWMHSVTWDAIIADETHKWLINTRGKSASQVGYGFTKLRVTDEHSPMYALSGTPLKGKKINIFGTLNWMWPKTYTSKWRFAESFWVVEKDLVDTGRRGGVIETRTITDKWIDEDSKAAFFRGLSPVMIRRTKDELRRVNPAWMPPEKRYHDVYIPIEGAQRANYNAMLKQSAATIDGGRLTATGVLAEMTRLKQFAATAGKMEAGVFRPALPSAKFNWIMQFLEERGIEGDGLSEDVQKVVIASQFTQVLNLWADELEHKGIDVLKITGEVKDRHRGSAMELFQSDDAFRVMLINTNAGGVSITLDAADDIVIADETWVPDEQEQVEDRVHRASNVEHQVDVWYLRAVGTIEEDIAQANQSKAVNNHVVLDAQRGLRFAAERFGASVEEE